jgi:hypothetical protein
MSLVWLAFAYYDGVGWPTDLLGNNGSAMIIHNTQNDAGLVNGPPAGCLQRVRPINTDSEGFEVLLTEVPDVAFDRGRVKQPSHSET